MNTVKLDALVSLWSLQAGEAPGRSGAHGLRSQHLLEVRGHQLPYEAVSPGGGAHALNAAGVGRHEAQSGS